MKNIQIDGYLNEKKLGEVLDSIFEGISIIRQHRIKIDSKLFIIDYKFEVQGKTFFVEFNGYRHYTETKTEIRDEMLRYYCKSNGIGLIEIPYFVQLNNDTLPYYFDDSVLESYITGVEIDCKYPHGFHDKKCVLPCDFNMRGWDKFAKEYSAFANEDMFHVMCPIYESLVNGWDTVLNVGRSCEAELTPEMFIRHYPT